MKERALKWVLRLLGIALAIGPLIIAIGMHDWDIKEAVLPSEAEIAQMQESVTGIFGGGITQNPFTPGDPIFSGTTVRMPMSFTSPLNIPVKITDISLKVIDQGVQVAQLHMEQEEVEVSARGTVNFTLIGSYTGDIPTDPQFTDMSITFEFYGLTAKMQIGSM